MQEAVIKCLNDSYDRGDNKGLLISATGVRVIIMTEANSQGNKRVFRLLPKLKTEKLRGWCAV